MQSAARIGSVHGGEAVRLLRRTEERGVAHAQRLEDPFGQEAVEGEARGHLHQPSQHVRRKAVAPLRARLVKQMHLSQVVDDLLQAAAPYGRQAVGAEHLVDDQGAGHAGGVAQQVAHRDVAAGRDRAGVAGVRSRRHREPPQRGQVLPLRGRRAAACPRRTASSPPRCPPPWSSSRCGRWCPRASPRRPRCRPCRTPPGGPARRAGRPPPRPRQARGGRRTPAPRRRYGRPGRPRSPVPAAARSVSTAAAASRLHHSRSLPSGRRASPRVQDCPTLGAGPG